MEGKTEDQWSVRIHRAWTAALCWPERWPGPQVQRAFTSSSHSGASKTPRAEGASGSLMSPRSDIQTKVFRDSREQGSPCRAFSPARAAEPTRLPQRRGNQSPRPRRGAPAPQSAGCGHGRHVGSPAALRQEPLPARPSLCAPAAAPAGAERDPPPITLHQSEGICGR